MLKAFVPVKTELARLIIIIMLKGFVPIKTELARLIIIIMLKGFVPKKYGRVCSQRIYGHLPALVTLLLPIVLYQSLVIQC